MGNASKVVSSLVGSFNACDMARIMSHFTEESVYHNIPVAPVSGEKAIREVIQNFMGMSSKVDWEVLHLVEGSNGKIKAWRDYFDMNQFQSQLAG